MKIVKKFWNAPLRWTDLAKIGKNKIANSTVVWMFIVPFAAKILHESKKLELDFGGELFVIILELPFSWELLFYASLMFAIGTTIYHLACPKFLRLYENYPNFIDSGQVGRTIISVFCATLENEKSYQHVSKKDDAAYQFTLDYLEGGEKFAEDIYELKNSKEEWAKMMFTAKIIEGRSREAFVYLFNFCEDLNPNIRKAIFICYLFGFVLIGAIVVQNVFYVLNS